MARANERADQRPAEQPAGREGEFERAFHEHYSRVFGVLYRLLGDRAEAEDLTVETFWRLWTQPPRQAGPLGGWLYRVAVRLGYNTLRARRRRQRYEEDAGRLSLEQSPPPDPAVAAEQALQRQRVRAVLAQLPERSAKLLVLRYSGLSYQEIAAALGVAPASVGTLLARAEDEFERRFGGGEPA